MCTNCCSRPCPVSYPSSISFPRNALTTLELRWVKSRLPWQLASGASLLMAGLLACLPAGDESKSRRSVWLLSLFLSDTPAQPFQANEVHTQYLWEAWVQFCVPITNEYSGLFPFWLFCLLLSLIVIFELVQTCIPHFLSPFVWVCSTSLIHTTGEGNLQAAACHGRALVNLHSAVIRATTYPWSQPFDSTTKVLPSWWDRLPRVLPLPVQHLSIKLQLSCAAYSIFYIQTLLSLPSFYIKP